MEISRIRADRVFEKYSYDFILGNEEGFSEAGRMRIAYAPNGRGKTNTLRAVAHLLQASPESLIALSDSPIGRILIEFGPDASICFEKLSAFDATYNIIVRDEARETSVEASIDAESMSRRQLQFRFFREKSDARKVIEAVRQLHPGAIWIGADRLSSSREVEVEEVAHRQVMESPNRARRDALEDLLERVEKLFSSSALRTVSQDHNRVYARLTGTLLGGHAAKRSTATVARANLEARIEELREKGEGSAKYNLVSLGELEGIGEQLSAVRQNKRELVTLEKILEPYFELLEKQLEAMEPTRFSVEAFISSSNMFLEEKRVKFKSGEGISLTGDGDSSITPRALSSGERHILLLLAQSVIAADSHKMLIIDEPEISLGIDWQRYLLANLLKCTSAASSTIGNPQKVQLLIATHSLQVMGEVAPEDIVSARATSEVSRELGAREGGAGGNR